MRTDRSKEVFSVGTACYYGGASPVLPGRREVGVTPTAGRRTAAQRAAGAAPKWASALLLCAALLVAAPAAADDHDSQTAGHPLRIVAYVLHPVGVVLDTLIFKPAHWLVHHEPFTTLFGHHKDD